MKRNPIFIYNNIDKQNLVYANQLTVKQWNDIINKLTAQANANTSFLETWTRWFFGPIEYTTEDEYTDSLGTYDSYYDYLKAEFNRIDTRITNEVTRLDGRINEEIANRVFQDTILSDRIDQHEIVVENLVQDVNNRFTTVNETLNKKINKDFSGLSVASSVHKEDKVIVRCAGCDGKEPVTYTLTVGALTELINSEVNYFKGYHASFVALQTAHPTGEPGDYAFVATENDDQYHMYVWDEEEKPGRWEETISGQYALASSFEEFQQGLMDGSIHVGAVKGNVNDTEETDPLLVNIEINGNKYILPSLDLDFLGDAVEGAYKLGAIKINGDTWNVNNDIVTLEMSDENIDGAYELGSININGNKWNVLKLSTVNAKIAELKAYLDANNFNKGEFLSLEKLQEKHPEGKPGEFAFVNTPTDQGDVMLMYVWDEDANTWKETTSQQYVLNSEFEQFKNSVGGVDSFFYVENTDSISSSKIYEVPVFYEGKLPLEKEPVEIKKIYINKQLPDDVVDMILKFALMSEFLVDDLNFSNITNNNDQYFLEYYDEISDLYYDIGLAYRVNNGNPYLRLFAEAPSGSFDIWDSNGWYDVPEYIEFNVPMYSYISANGGTRRTSKLFAALMSNIFSTEPFEVREFNGFHIKSDYYHLDFSPFDEKDSVPWNKINGGSSDSEEVVNAFVDVESLETKTGGNVIPQTGKVDSIYFNTSLSSDEIINALSKLEVGETMPQYYILISDDMRIMLLVGLQSQPTAELGEMDSGADYIITLRDRGDEYIVWHSGQGWDPDGNFGSDLENGLQLGINLITPEGLASVGFPDDAHCGDQNDLLVSVVSTEKGNFEYTEPKEAAVGNKDKVYRMVGSNEDYTYHQIKNDEWEYFGGNIIPVNNLSDAEKLVGTPITKYENAGPVTVYINKTLTNEQVQELCSKIYYDNTGRYFVSGNFFCMGFVMIGNVSLQPTSIQGDAQDNYQIFAYDKNTDEEIEIWSTSEGWSNNCPDSVTIDTNLPMETSIEPLSEEDAEEFIGKYNNLIKDLLSATPFKIGADTKAIYRVKEDNPPKVVKSAVPVGGSGKSIDKIFVNLNLSNEEMLKLFNSVIYVAQSYDYKSHYVIHSVGKEDPNRGFVETYNLHIIEYGDNNYELTLTEWLDRGYNRVCLYSTIDGWNPDISNYVNADGSLREDIAGTKAFEYEGCTFGNIGLENDNLIDLIYNQTIEETYDYAYYQYTSNGWERYGVGVIPVKELPSAEIPTKYSSEYLGIPNTGALCKLKYNNFIHEKTLLKILKEFPEEAWINNRYCIYDFDVSYSGDSAIYYANLNMYFERELDNNGIYTYYLKGQDGSNSFEVFYITDTNGSISWIGNGYTTDHYLDYANNRLNNEDEKYTFVSQRSDDSDNKYEIGNYNHLLTEFVYIDNPEYNPNYKPAISQTVLYRVDTNEGSKYYNFNGTNWTEVGTGAGGLSQEDMDAILQEAKSYTDEMKQSLLGEGISETFDTLKEIQDWIETDGVEATELSTQLAKKQNKLTAGNGITISEDGTISLNIPLAETEEY